MKIAMVTEIPAVGIVNASGTSIGVGITEAGDVCLQVENAAEETWMSKDEARVLVALLNAAINAQPGDYV